MVSITFKEELLKFFIVGNAYYDNQYNEIYIFKSLVQSPSCEGRCLPHIQFGACTGLMLRFKNDAYKRCPYHYNGSTRFIRILDTNERW